MERVTYYQNKIQEVLTEYLADLRQPANKNIDFIPVSDKDKIIFKSSQWVGKKTNVFLTSCFTLTLLTIKYGCKRTKWSTVSPKDWSKKVFLKKKLSSLISLITIVLIRNTRWLNRLTPQYFYKMVIKLKINSVSEGKMNVCEKPLIASMF